MFEYQDLQIFGFKCNFFHPLEIVALGSETQIQMGENFNGLQWMTKTIYLLMLSPVLHIFVNYQLIFF